MPHVLSRILVHPRVSQQRRRSVSRPLNSCFAVFTPYVPARQHGASTHSAQSSRQCAQRGRPGCLARRACTSCAALTSHGIAGQPSALATVLACSRPPSYSSLSPRPPAQSAGRPRPPAPRGARAATSCLAGRRRRRNEKPCVGAGGRGGGGGTGRRMKSPRGGEDGDGQDVAMAEG